MNSIFGRNTVPHKRLFLLPLAILILLGYSSTTIDFANVAIAQDYNEDNFNQGDESMVVSTSNSGTDEDSSMNDNLDENTNNQGLSGDSETGTNDNIDGSTYAQNDNSSSNENSSNGQEDVGSQDATTNKKLPPRAEAGSDIVTYEGDTVVLNGEKSSDDDGEIRSYHWLQIEGPEQITLRNVDTSFPTFQAPSVSSETKFRFELTVTDNDELSDTDSVDVTVSDRLIDAQQLSTDDNIQNIESSTDNSTFFNPQQNNGTIDSEREGTQILENNDSRGTINESTEQQISSQDSKVVSDGLVEEALNDMSNTGDVPSNETIELFTPQNSNHDESGAVDSNLSSTFELSNKSDKTINGTEVQLINSTTERFNMTGPITNGTEVQLINSTTERFNMTGPITNGTEVQLINSTDLLNLNNTMFNQTGTNPLSNISSVDRESLSASLVDSESDTAFKVNLLSYSVNNSELKVSELGKEIDFSLNNSAKVKLTPLNSSTDLEVSAMKLTGENGTNTILNNPENSKWVIDAPAGVYSLFIDAKYFPGNQNVQYGATIKVGGKKNLLPVADAGEDRVVNGNISVILDGTKSADPDGSISSYHWIQVSGEPFVTLAGVDTPHPSFITPSNLRNDSNISFRLLITDNDGANSTDDVNVLIKNTTLLPKVEGTVILEPVPKTLSAGDYYEFKGTLNLTKIADGSYVQIRNGEGSQYDELLTFGPVESGGIFTAPWTAVPREGLLNIYATYTDIGGNVYQSESFPVKVLHFKSNPGAATKDANTSNRPVKAGSNLEPFMEVHYSDWNKDHLNVYILAIDPSAQGSIGKAKNAVSDLSKIVKQETGNNAAWNFNIFATNGFPSPIQTATHPINILFSLSSIDDSVACGYNHILQRKKSEFTSNEVFTSSRCGDVYKSTMHEFLHSLGLGHTWHEVDDMMCSTEWFLGTNKWTCDNDVDPYNDHNKPTEFNVRALVHTYGNNGFQEPNANIREDYDPRTDVKYYCTPLPCEPHIANVPPVADAGISQSSKVGTKVILDGSGSTDSDGSINSFSWAQIEGPKVKLYNSETSKAYFFMPTDLTTSTKLVFELTVVDDKGLRAVDSVDVKAIITSNSEQVEKSTSQNNVQADIFKVLVRLNNINPNLGYENSAIILKGDLFQKQQLAYQHTNNTGTAETTFVFPSTLIGTGETFVVCVEQGSSTGEEGIACKIGLNSPSTTAEVIEFMLPSSGKFASDVVSNPVKTLGTATVKIVNRSSNPDNQNHLVPFFLKVSRGDTVVWKNEDVVSHTITSGTLGGTNSGILFDSGSITSGKTFEHTFQKSGKYNYYCKIHPFITGEVNVS